MMPRETAEEEEAIDPDLAEARRVDDDEDEDDGGGGGGVMETAENSPFSHLLASYFSRWRDMDKWTEMLSFSMKHSGQTMAFQMPAEETTVSDLKHKVYEMTNVLPMRQKIVGLFAASNVKSDATLLTEALTSQRGKPWKSSRLLKFVMMGTPEDKIIKDPHELQHLPDVINDLDLDYMVDVADDPQLKPENLQRLKSKVDTIDVHLMHPPRAGKKLCVIDIDYTIFDCKSKDLPLHVVKRPFTDELLERIYQDFDIVFWSQTHWRWVEAKLTELGILTNPRFKVTFILDRTSMFGITSRHRGQMRKHEVKPLQFIWEKFPAYYDQNNTVHLDDLSRNFAMNPKNGIKVKAFKNAQRMRGNDRELFLVSELLTKVVASCDNVTKIDLTNWRATITNHLALQTSSSSSNRNNDNNNSEQS